VRKECGHGEGIPGRARSRCRSAACPRLCSILPPRSRGGVLTVSDQDAPRRAR
jgi:hypothetical protein